MTDEQFAKMMEELMAKIDGGPGSNTEVLAKLAEKHTAIKEFQKAINEINDSLAAVRIVLKYLMFDLEATRRERDELRMKLEDMD